MRKIYTLSYYYWDGKCWLSVMDQFQFRWQAKVYEWLYKHSRRHRHPIIHIKYIKEGME